MEKPTTADRLIDLTHRWTYARLIAAETIFLCSIVVLIMGQRHLVVPLEQIATVITTLFLVASAAGGILIGLRVQRDLNHPIARHLRQELSYHVLMGVALAATPGAIVGAFGDGLGLAAAFCGWAVFTVPLTALLMYEEAQRFRAKNDTLSAQNAAD